MAGGTQRHVSIRQTDREIPDSPTGSRRRYADLPDGLESHENTPKMPRHAHSDVDGSNTPENAPVTYLPEEQYRAWVSPKQKSSGTRWTRWTHAPRRRALRAIRERLHTRQNTSKSPNSPGRSAETCTVIESMQN